MKTSEYVHGWTIGNLSTGGLNASPSFRGHNKNTNGPLSLGRFKKRLRVPPLFRIGVPEL